MNHAQTVHTLPPRFVPLFREPGEMAVIDPDLDFDEYGDEDLLDLTDLRGWPRKRPGAD